MKQWKARNFVDSHIVSASFHLALEEQDKSKQLKEQSAVSTVSAVPAAVAPPFRRMALQPNAILSPDSQQRDSLDEFLDHRKGVTQRKRLPTLPATVRIVDCIPYYIDERVPTRPYSPQCLPSARFSLDRRLVLVGSTLCEQRTEDV